MDSKSALFVAAVNAAGIMAFGLSMRWLHRRYVDPLQFPNKELAGEVRQTRVVTIDCGPDQALLAARDAVLSLRKSKVAKMAGRTLEARIGMSFRTFGEVIVVSAEAADAGTSRLSIESRPRMPGTELDHGKSYENVERIFAHLARAYEVCLVSASAAQSRSLAAKHHIEHQREAEQGPADHHEGFCKDPVVVLVVPPVVVVDERRTA